MPISIPLEEKKVILVNDTRRNQVETSLKRKMKRYLSVWLSNHQVGYILLKGQESYRSLFFYWVKSCNVRTAHEVHILYWHYISVYLCSCVILNMHVNIFSWTFRRGNDISNQSRSRQLSLPYYINRVSVIIDWTNWPIFMIQVDVCRCFSSYLCAS